MKNYRTHNEIVFSTAATRSFELTNGERLEEETLEKLDALNRSASSAVVSWSLSSEVPPNHAINDWVNSARVSFIRQMTYGLVVAAVQSYDSGDWDALGQAIVDWTSTLELEADRPTRRRIERRTLRSGYGT